MASLIINCCPKCGAKRTREDIESKLRLKGLMEDFSDIEIVLRCYECPPPCCNCRVVVVQRGRWLPEAEGDLVMSAALLTRTGPGGL